MAWLRIDLLSYLFGDILAVTVADLWVVCGGGALVLALLVGIWRPLLAASVHEDLARAEGVPVGAVRLAFMLLIAVVIALAMKIVGILLITSLLIIPAATARRFARTPEAMAVIAALIGCSPSPAASPCRCGSTRPPDHRSSSPQQSCSAWRSCRSTAGGLAPPSDAVTLETGDRDRTPNSSG